MKTTPVLGRIFFVYYILWLMAISITAFPLPHPMVLGSRSLHRLQSSSVNNNDYLSEFNYVLQEIPTTSENRVSTTTTTSRRRITLGEDRSVLFTSSVAGPSFPGATSYTTAEESEANTVEDPFAEELQLGKIQQFQQQQPVGLSASLSNKLKQMDLQDIIVTFAIPSIALFAAGRWGYNRAASRVQATIDTILNGFAKEMIYHDGNFREMELCIVENQRKLWSIPNKVDLMLKRYLEDYAKKRPISPQAISSLSFVFTVFKLSEARAANILVSLCREMGTDKIASAGKLLFLGSRILKSPEGLAALNPIKELIKSTYRDATVAEAIVETSQHAIAEASYRAAVQAAGKNQQKLTIGWEVLGLEKETALRIFNEEAKEGFVSDRETMYGRQTQKYDKSGNRINKDGSLENPIPDKPRDDSSDDDDDE